MESETGVPYGYGADDPLDLSDPTGMDVCVFGHCVSTPSLPSLQQVGDWAAGFGDTVTFGGTKQIRRLINYAQTGNTSDIGVDQCDDFYHWGNIGGDFANVFDSIVVPGTVTGWVSRIPGVGRSLIGSSRLGADSRLFGNDSLGSGGVSGSLNRRGTAWAAGWSIHPDVGLPVFRIRVPGGDHLPIFFGQFL